MGMDIISIGRREKGEGRREKGEGRREKGEGRREKEVFGLSEDTLKHDGRLIPAAIGLSHAEQLDRLAEGCKDALPIAFIAGDPCYDRLLASAPRRLDHRHALGLVPGQRLITVNSTWREESLFGLDLALVPRLMARLPYDEFRVALVLHPNAWAAHGRAQIELWIDDALRAGLILVPPDEGWRAAVIAADHVISDHGSVGVYAAAVGRPVLLDPAGREAIDPESGLGRLFEAARELDPETPIRPQLREAERRVARTHATATAWVSSAPGESLRLIRDVAYRIMGTAPPTVEPPLLAAPALEIPGAPGPSCWVHVEQWGGHPGDLAVRRVPAAVAGFAPSAARAPLGVLIANGAEDDHRIAGMADIMSRHRSELPADEETWSADTFRHRPGARLTVVHDDAGASVRTRDGDRIRIDLDPVGHPASAELLCTVLAERMATGAPTPEAVAALSPLRVRVADDHTVEAAFLVTTG
ncbi:hypothetical protein ACFOVU_19995 [Nocardiopsis sediminis]|uniref:Translation initiation factor 2 n=1 Tax=Nocardiopsis sediminis TaxID=1778267 RepID=A0ABV8FT16_9ACTN